MSADNYIYIDQKTFEVWECVASKLWTGKKKWTLEAQKGFLVGEGKNLKEAMEIANKASNETEYGIFIRLWAK